MHITALEPQVNNPERVNLYVDGRFLLGVSAAIVLQMGLRLNQELRPDQLEQLRSEESEQQAVDRALNYLSFRPRSREVVDELVDAEQDEERALRAGRKKAVSLVNIPHMDYATFRNRLGSFLQRRGFGYEIVSRTVRSLWKELRPEEVDRPRSSRNRDHCKGEGG